jgi:sialate O-acetylesterase
MVWGQVVLPKIFSDHMVLQREMPISIWGTSSPNEKITMYFHNQKKTIHAGRDGKWKISFASETAGGPYDLTIKAKTVIVLKDILVGDVWVCSGQSNMEWPLVNTQNAAREIASANLSQMRQFKVPLSVALEPKDDLQSGEWKVCNKTNAAEFTAVGYYFAKRLIKDLSVPVGLINSSWGGTQIESWISRDAFEQDEEFKQMISGLPVVNLDSLASIKYKEYESKIGKLQSSLPRNRAEAELWKEVNYNDEAWRVMKAPMLWEAQELNDFDGVVWLRKRFTLEKGLSGLPGKLSLAKIDDSDETYVNGIKVGETSNKWNEPRTYEIAPGILREGENVITVRVEDNGGGGGIHGDSSMLKLVVNDIEFKLAGNWKYKIEAIRKSQTIGPNLYPTILYNAMINPIIHFNIRGALWYQGEANASRAYQYRKSFPLLIMNWRNKWQQSDLPFYFVQLSSFNEFNGTSASGSMWAELREAQALTLSLPNTGMAVTTDIGDPLDIHPRNKKDVGERLAGLALKGTYHKAVISSGPAMTSFKVEDNKIVMTFDQPLMVNDKYNYVRGFEIAGEDRKFVFAKAEVDGNTVTVWANNVKKPVAVRYGWADDASDCNLFNGTGLPVAPFRTDTWQGITEQTKYSF